MSAQPLLGVGHLADRIAAAHGGRDAWRRLGEVSVSFSAGGLAFAAKGRRRTLEGVTATLSTTCQRMRLHGVHPSPWEWSVRDGVELAAALQRLRTGRRRVRWRVEDVAAFAGAALWTYTNLPFRLADPGCNLELLPSVVPGLHRLAVELPSHVVTHAPRHVLHVDDDGIIRRHDYTAVAFGTWARASQQLDAYRWCESVLVPTRRRVTPRLPRQRAASGPTLVWVDVADLRATGA